MSKAAAQAIERPQARRRVLVMALAGIAVAAPIAARHSLLVGAVAGWASACLVYLVWVWRIILRLDGEATRRHATFEEPGHRVAELMILVASLAGIAAVSMVVVIAHHAAGTGRAAIGLFALLSVGLSWALVHTLYALRYARLYYEPPEGGIAFGQESPPRYSDFAYLSFTLGMTFQVSDTGLLTSEIRVVALRHAMLAYLFGSVILAGVVNLVAGLG